MKRKDFTNWKKVRHKGIWTYVFQHGVLTWGLTMLVSMAFVRNPFVNGIFSQEVLLHFTIWPTAGFLYGLLTWYLSEHRFQKAKKKHDKNT